MINTAPYELDQLTHNFIIVLGCIVLGSVLVISFGDSPMVLFVILLEQI